MYIKLTATGVLNKHQALLSRTAKITKYSLIQTTNKSVKIIKIYIFTYSFLNECIYTRIDNYHNSVAPHSSALCLHRLKLRLFQEKSICLNNRNQYLFLLNLQNMPKSYASFFLLRRCLKWTIQFLSIVVDSYLISWHYSSLWQTRPNFKYNNTTTTLYLTYNVIKTQLSYFLYRYDCYCIKNIIITYNTCLY